MVEIARQRTRVGTLISQAIRPFSVRARRDSGGSPNSEVTYSAKQDYFSRPATKATSGNRPLSLNIPRIPARTTSIETFDQVQDDRHLSMRPPTQDSDDSTRASSTDAPPTQKADSDLPSLPSVSMFRSDGPECPPVPPKDLLPPSRWRFFPFRRDTSQSTATQGSAVSTLNFVPQPAKGDIVCLNYSSLDDRGMRLLEGRSDHRPVVGSYAVYL